MTYMYILHTKEVQILKWPTKTNVHISILIEIKMQIKVTLKNHFWPFSKNFNKPLRHSILVSTSEENM